MKHKEFQEAIIITIDRIEELKREIRKTTDPVKKDRLRSKLKELFFLRLEYLNTMEVK